MVIALGFTRRWCAALAMGLLLVLHAHSPCGWAAVAAELTQPPQQQQQQSQQTSGFRLLETNGGTQPAGTTPFEGGRRSRRARRRGTVASLPRARMDTDDSTPRCTHCVRQRGTVVDASRAVVPVVVDFSSTNVTTAGGRIKACVVPHRARQWTCVDVRVDEAQPANPATPATTTTAEAATAVAGSEGHAGVLLRKQEHIHVAFRPGFVRFQVCVLLPGNVVTGCSADIMVRALAASDTSYEAIQTMHPFPTLFALHNVAADLPAVGAVVVFDRVDTAPFLLHMTSLLSSHRVVHWFTTSAGDLDLPVGPRSSALPDNVVVHTHWDNPYVSRVLANTTVALVSFGVHAAGLRAVEMPHDQTRPLDKNAAGSHGMALEAIMCHLVSGSIVFLPHFFNYRGRFAASAALPSEAEVVDAWMSSLRQRVAECFGCGRDDAQPLPSSTKPQERLDESDATTNSANQEFAWLHDALMGMTACPYVRCVDDSILHELVLAMHSAGQAWTIEDLVSMAVVLGTHPGGDAHRSAATWLRVARAQQLLGGVSTRGTTPTLQCPSAHNADGQVVAGLQDNTWWYHATRFPLFTAPPLQPGHALGGSDGGSSSSSGDGSGGISPVMCAAKLLHQAAQLRHLNGRTVLPGPARGVDVNANVNVNVNGDSDAGVGSQRGWVHGAVHSLERLAALLMDVEQGASTSTTHYCRSLLEASTVRVGLERLGMHSSLLDWPRWLHHRPLHVRASPTVAAGQVLRDPPGAWGAAAVHGGVQVVHHAVTHGVVSELAQFGVDSFVWHQQVRCGGGGGDSGGGGSGGGGPFCGCGTTRGACSDARAAVFVSTPWLGAASPLLLQTGHALADALGRRNATAPAWALRFERTRALHVSTVSKPRRPFVVMVPSTTHTPLLSGGCPHSALHVRVLPSGEAECAVVAKPGHAPCTLPMDADITWRYEEDPAGQDVQEVDTQGDGKEGGHGALAPVYTALSSGSVVVWEAPPFAAKSLGVAAVLVVKSAAPTASPLGGWFVYVFEMGVRS